MLRETGKPLKDVLYNAEVKKSGLEEWHVQGVMALYSGASTMVRTCAGESRRFEVRVGLHQGLVLSPLLLSIVMDVVLKEVASRPSN